MQLYSEYVINEGIKDMWKVFVDKMKRIISATPLQSIKELLEKSRLGRVFFGKANPDAIQTKVPSGTAKNILANLAYLKSLGGNSKIHEALNGFRSKDGDQSQSSIVQVNKKGLMDQFEDLMYDIDEHDYNHKDPGSYNVNIIFGAIGIGKTSIVKEVIRQWNAAQSDNNHKRNLILVDGGQLTSDTFLLPSLVDVTDSKKHIATSLNINVEGSKVIDKGSRLKAAPATFLPCYAVTGDKVTDAAQDAVANGCEGMMGVTGDGGLIVIDEFLRTDPGVFKTIMNIIQQRLIGNGEYAIGSKWMFVLLSNRPCDDDEVAEAYDSASDAFLARYQYLLYIPTAKEWIEWARTAESGMCPEVVDYVEQHPDKYHAKCKDENFYLTPRRWDEVSTAVNKALSRKAKGDYKVLLSMLNTYTDLRSADDAAMSEHDKMADMVCVNIAKKIGVSEAKEFCSWLCNKLEDRFKGKKNTNVDDNIKVSNGIKSILKEEIANDADAQPQTLFSITDSDTAENLASDDFCASLQITKDLLDPIKIKDEYRKNSLLDNKFISLFGVYPGSSDGKISFVTRTVTAGYSEYMNLKSIEYEPLKGTLAEAALEDTKMLSKVDYTDDTEFYFADYLLLNHNIIMDILSMGLFNNEKAGITQDRDACVAKYGEELVSALESFLSQSYFKQERLFKMLKDITILINAKSGGNSKAKSDFDGQIYSFIKTLWEKYLSLFTGESTFS